MMNKKALRHEFTDKRKKLTDEEARSLSRQLAGRFIHSFDLREVKYLHVYLPLLRRREIDTYLLVEQIRTLYPKVYIVIPKADASTGSMESYLFDEETELAYNEPWGIVEPVDGNLVTPDRIDWIVLPLLAFDEQGYRVGYGKGYYDRYLTRCRPDIRKIGLSYFDPVNKIEDTSEWDIQMDYCIAPSKLWVFSSSEKADINP